MATDIVLKDRNGKDVTYEGIETVTFDTPTEGEQATFTHGTVVEGVSVEPDFSEGDQVISVPEGFLVKEATIKKPDALAAENIKKGVTIAGVEGDLIGEGVPKEISDLDFSDGDVTVLADPETLMSEVVIKTPPGLEPGNIADGVTIAGIRGNAPLSDFDSSDENLKYLAYHIDIANKEVIVRNASLYARNQVTGINAIVIPNRLGGYKVAIADNWVKRAQSSGPFGALTYAADLNIGAEVRYVNGDMSYLASGGANVNTPIPVPNGVTNMAYAFHACRSYNHPVNIPNSVVNMTMAFGMCNNFNKPVSLGNNVNDMYRAFYNCFNLNQPFTIPDSVMNLVEAFNYCSAFNSPVVIGNNVTSLNYTFYNCKKMGQDIVIHAKNVTTVRYMLGGKNNSIRVNIFVHAGSSTENTIRTASQGVTGSSMYWTNDPENNCFYNTTYNIYVYNNL